MRISCRAQVHPDCKKEWEATDEDMTDSTLDGADSVVCFACYIIIEPFMMMNREDVAGAADEALYIYKENLAFVRAADDEKLPGLVADAEANIARSRPGSPFHISAIACKAMAQGEIDRRANG